MMRLRIPSPGLDVDFELEGLTDQGEGLMGRDIYIRWGLELHCYLAGDVCHEIVENGNAQVVLDTFT